MKKVQNRFFALLLIGAISFSSAFIIKNRNEASSQLWAGATYAASKSGNHSEEECFGISVVGIGQTALWGLGLGGPAGVAVGAAFGL